MSEVPYRYRKRFLDCHKMTLEEAEEIGEWLAVLQRDVMFHIGDIARYSESRWPDTWNQIFPPWMSQGLVQRTAGVCKAYPTEEDRQIDATYSQYMQQAGKPDRLERLAEIEEKGLTTDESRKADQEERSDKTSWLLAVDVNYHLTKRWSAGDGTEAAMHTATWINRTVNRLKEKGLTDCVCCMDSPNSFRKELTAHWEKKYKERATKDPEHAQQLLLVRELIENFGYACVSQDLYEADDLLASYAAQFPGKVTLLTVDKDMRQCLSAKCNMLPDIVWKTNELTGEQEASYPWITAKQHYEEGCTYVGAHVSEISAEDWPEFQTLAGDSSDTVDGARGIGVKIASSLLKEFGTIEKAIEAAKNDDERIKPRIRESLIEFENKLAVTRMLVTLCTDLDLEINTRIL